MESKIIEIDVDGVMGNIHQGLNQYVQHIYQGFDGDKHIETWDMKELNKLDERLRPEIFRLFGEPDFISSMKWFAGVPEALKKLDNFAKENNLRIVINTNSFEGSVNAKKYWVTELLKAAVISCEVVVLCDNPKKMLNSLIVFEDSPKNLQNSSAPIKFLIRRGHNRWANISDLGETNQVYIVDDFKSAVNIVLTNKAVKELIHSM